MSYTPTNWQTGDTITAEKLNNMESGIAKSAVYDMLVTATVTSDSIGIRSVSVDKTASEVSVAVSLGRNVGMLFVVVPYNGTPWSAFASYSLLSGLPTWTASVSGLNVSSSTTVSEDSVCLQIFGSTWQLLYAGFPNPAVSMVYDYSAPPSGKLFGIAPEDGLFGWQSPCYEIELGDTLEQLMTAALLQAGSGNATITTELDSATAAILYGICMTTHKYMSAGWGVFLSYEQADTYATAVATSETVKGPTSGVTERSATFSGRLAFSFTSSTAESYDITIETMARQNSDETYEAIASITAEKIAHTFIS